MKTDYILRHAAGDWWLIDAAQKGDHFRKPQRVNHTAAEIIGMLLDNKSLEEITTEISSRYGAAEETVRQDVQDLMKQLEME